MATIGGTAFTWIDWAKQIDPDGTTADVIDLLSQTNEVLTDMLAVEGNLPTGHQSTVLTGYPTTYWRMLNQGIPSSKDSNAQITDTVGMLEAWSVIDKDVAELNGNTASFRLARSKPFLASMSQTMATAIFYGNQALDPEQFNGFAPRYSLLSAGNGDNIIDAGGTDVAGSSSIWLITWGDMTAHGIFPKGSKVGLIREDLGLETVYDTSVTPPTMMRAYREHFQWKNGLAVPDWRYHVRIANIDVSNLIAESSAADLVKLMIRAINKAPANNMGRRVFYMNGSLYTMLMIQAMNKSLNALAIQEAAKQFEMSFMGIPIRRVDALLNTEARVV